MKQKNRFYRVIVLLIIFAAPIFLLMIAMPGRTAPQSGCLSGACISTGPEMVTIDSTQTALLDAINSSLLDVNMGLTEVEWNAVNQYDVGLRPLLEELQADLSLSSVEEVLTTSVTLDTVLQSLVDVATVDGNSAAANALISLQSDLLPLTGTITLDSLLTLNMPANGVSNIDLNSLELISGLTQLYNYEHINVATTAVTLPGASIGLGSLLNTVDLQAIVTTPPVFLCGVENSSFGSAGMRLKLAVDLQAVSLDVSALTNALDILLPLHTVEVEAGLSQLDIYVDVAAGTGVLRTVDATNSAIVVEATPSSADLYLGDIDDALFFDRSHIISTTTDLNYGLVGNLAITTTILGTPTAVSSGIELKSFVEGEVGVSTTITATDSFPQTITPTISADYTTDLINDLLNNTQFQLSGSLGALLDPFVNGTILPLLQTEIDTNLNGIVSTLIDDAVSPIMHSAGVLLGSMNINFNGLRELCHDLSITLSHVGNFSVGVTGTYRIEIENVGELDVTSIVTVTNTLPDGLSYLSHAGTGWTLIASRMESSAVSSPQQLIFAYANPVPIGGLTPDLIIEVDVAETAVGVITNTAEVVVAGDVVTANNIDVDTILVTQADADGDGVFDILEDVDGDGNLLNDDTDGDLIPNFLDDDDDGDNILTINEDFGGDGNPANDDADSDGVPDYLEPNDVDTDGDLTPNNLDIDDDGDGIISINEDRDNNGSPLLDDSDGDDIPDFLDMDDDNDNILTKAEDVDSDGNPTNDDTDNDSVPDYLEPNDVDTDNDGLMNHEDDDDDGDGIPTEDEDINGDGDPTNDDSDGDGIPDFLEGDSDGDGLLNSAEDLNGDGNPNNDDSDQDGIPNYRDSDDDNDGILTKLEDLNNNFDPSDDDNDGDSIPNYLESNLLDVDLDLTANVNDDDDDGNGILTIDEDFNNDNNVLNDDLDGDGWLDYIDLDDDQDLLPDLAEDRNNDLNILNDDSDGDGMVDFRESNILDLDGDDNPDYLDPDDDGDGVLTAVEDINNDGNPYNDDSDGDGVPNFVEANNADLDEDGTFDHLDSDDDGDGVPSNLENLDGAGGPMNDDTDGDGVPNYRDMDDDGDGISSASEDYDGDGDPSNDDINQNGIADYLDASYPQFIYLPFVTR